MNLSAQIIQISHPASPSTIRATPVTDEIQIAAGLNGPPFTRHRGRSRNTLAVVSLALFSALALGMTSGVAQAQSLVATVPSGPNPVAIAVNAATNTVYVADIDIKTLLAINGVTNATTAIPAGGPFVDVGVNPATNTIYALNEGSQSSTLSGIVVTPGSVAVIDGASNTVTATIALPALGSHLVVNPVTNKVYVSALNAIGNGAIVNVTVIDGATNTITTTISIPQIISSMAVDTARNVIYAMYENAPGDATIAAINGATNTVIGTTLVGYNDNTFALNGTTNIIYVPDAHGNQIFVIDAATGTVTATLPGPASPLAVSAALTVNQATNTIYTTAYNSSNGTDSLRVLDGATDTVTATIANPATGFYHPLLANSVTNKIWQVSSPVVVIDGATNTATSVTGTSGLSVSIGALNTTTNFAFLAGPNNVYVISGAPAGPAFSASPNPLAFGNQTQGTTSTAKTLTVTNTGTTNLSITTVAAGGTNMADFPVGSDTCSGATVAAGKTCTVSVEFDPSTTAAESATLTFTDDASDSPEVVNLTGTGTAPVPTQSTTALSASSTSVSVGTSVTLTATVTPASGTPAPTGAVTFKDGSATIGTGTLNGSGVATYTTSALAIGTHSISASYPGDSRNLASGSAPVSVTVAQDATTTALTASASSLAVGAMETFTATVTGPSGAAAPTGSVKFNDGTTVIGTGTLNGSGVATYSTSALAAGTHNITAAYAGDTNNAGSASSAVAITVWPGAADFTLALSSSSGTFKAGSPITVTITVTSVNGFNAATALSCGSLPTNTTCAFSAASITPAVSGTATSTLTIDTNVSTTTALAKDRHANGSGAAHGRSGPQLEIAGAAGFLLLLPLVAGRSRRARRLLLAVCGMACLGLLVTAGISGCGGGPTTPKGTYSIQITGASGSVTHTSTFSLTVD